MKETYIYSTIIPYSLKGNQSGFKKELRLFKLIEQKTFETGLSNYRQVLSVGSRHNGLPKLLGFTLNGQQQEILMENAGPSLYLWQDAILDEEDRMMFVTEMLRQILGALQIVHRLGYAHSDIKLQNICARVKENGTLHLTLIDFGVSCKLRISKDKNTLKRFRGNLQTATPQHIARKRPDQVDELNSLLNAAFLFVKNSLPWLDDPESSGDSKIDNFKAKFSKYRWNNRVKHAKQLKTQCKEFAKLYKYLDKAQIKSVSAQQAGGAILKNEDRYNQMIDYDKLMLLLPKTKPLDGFYFKQLMEESKSSQQSHKSVQRAQEITLSLLHAKHEHRLSYLEKIPFNYTGFCKQELEKVTEFAKNGAKKNNLQEFKIIYKSAIYQAYCKLIGAEGSEKRLGSEGGNKPVYGESDKVDSQKILLKSQEQIKSFKSIFDIAAVADSCSNSIASGSIFEGHLESVGCSTSNFGSSSSSHSDGSIGSPHNLKFALNSLSQKSKCDSKGSVGQLKKLKENPSKPVQIEHAQPAIGFKPRFVNNEQRSSSQQKIQQQGPCSSKRLSNAQKRLSSECIEEKRQPSQQPFVKQLQQPRPLLGHHASQRRQNQLEKPQYKTFKPFVSIREKEIDTTDPNYDLDITKLDTDENFGCARTLVEPSNIVINCSRQVYESLQKESNDTGYPKAERSRIFQKRVQAFAKDEKSKKQYDEIFKILNFFTKMLS